MPTIEFFGFTERERSDAVSRVRELLEPVDFRDEIVFVLTGSESQTVVISWQFKTKPFIRLFSRSTERLRTLVECLRPHFDVETVGIGFFSRSACDPAVNE